MRILLFIKTLITASLLSPLSLAVADTLTVDGDLNVEGNVTVGTPTTGAGVIVHGESGSTAPPSLTVKGDGNVVFEEATGNGLFVTFSLDIGKRSTQMNRHLADGKTSRENCCFKKSLTVTRELKELP